MGLMHCNKWPIENDQRNFMFRVFAPATRLFVGLYTIIIGDYTELIGFHFAAYTLLWAVLRMLNCVIFSTIFLL